MTHWIVDGMNVIGSRPDGWWRDRPGAMRRLAGELDRWAGAEQERVTLVLDGRERDLGEHANVEVRFAPVADDLIAEIAGPGATVVTSDRGLIERLGGAEVEGPKTFRERLG